MRTIRKMPNLSNYTPGGIVDVCAPINEEWNNLKKDIDYYKTGLKARLSDDFKTDTYTYTVQGEEYTATITNSEQQRVDMDRIRALLTQKQIDECVKTIPMQTIRFYKNEKSKSGGKD